jgi:hypothetical protein
MWGALLMAQAGSRNFTDLAILRTISGAAEATADPAFVLITYAGPDHLFREY